MDLQLTDKIVVVTGAASGIGRATARLLSEEGAIVVGVDRDQIDTRTRRPQRPRPRGPIRASASFVPVSTPPRLTAT